MDKNRKRWGYIFDEKLLHFKKVRIYKGLFKMKVFRRIF